MTQLKQGYNPRPGSKDDIVGLLDLFNEYWQQMTGVLKFTREEFDNLFTAPGLDLESSLKVITDQQGNLLAGALVIDLGNPPLHPNVYGCVRKQYENNGLGAYLVDWAETRARKAVPRCPQGTRVSMYLLTAPSHEPTVALFEKLDLNPIRYQWFMMRNLDEVLPDPLWPQGIYIQTYESYPHLETILVAADEAFEDHWGHVDRSEDQERLERFRHSIENNPDFDPSLWYLAMDGEDIAGVALCSPNLGPDRLTGVVDTLGVRRSWRRKGLGLALLHHCFKEFRSRSYEKVGLGVDSQNLSGATRLYKRAGMEVVSEIAVYEKELRPGEELSKRS
jgi:ribosomal protein S18 acetylase RimI-like enzyme